MPRGVTRVFFQNFSRVYQHDEILLFPTKTKTKQPFLAAILKIQRVRSPATPTSTPVSIQRLGTYGPKPGMFLVAGMCALQDWTTRTGANSRKHSVAWAFWRFFAVVACREHMNNLITHAHLSFSYPQWALPSKIICVTSCFICRYDRRAPFSKPSRPQFWNTFYREYR